MPGTHRIARIFGLEINVHWSWLFIFVLVTWTFATGILQTSFPQWTESRRWVVGGFVSSLFFLSILLHEMSHSLLARRWGIPVSSITLFVFGGVSNLTKEPENARQEFWIAFVGPLTSFVIAAALGAIYFGFHDSARGLADVSGNLAVINASIGAFNLVPGYPLDGGRMLRSVFWARKHNILTATRMASYIGVLVSYGIMALAVASFVFYSVITGVWLFLIGNFLRGSSNASYEQMFLDKVLKTVPASSLATSDFMRVPPDMSLAQLADEHVLTGHGRCFAVVAGEELLGLFTLTDLKKVPRDAWATTTVFRAMTPAAQLRTVTMKDDLPKVLALMATADINQVPLMDGKLILGLIHRGDLIQYIQTRHDLSASSN